MVPRLRMPYLAFPCGTQNSHVARFILRSGAGRLPRLSGRSRVAVRILQKAKAATNTRNTKNRIATFRLMSRAYRWMPRRVRTIVVSSNLLSGNH